MTQASASPATQIPVPPAADSLEVVAAEVRACQRCDLCQSGQNGVPGEGPADARIMFIGEGPGYHEDRQGRPFVGPAGQLMTDLLGGIGLQRGDVYITNVVKHRPPGNRDPLPDEIAACRPFLERQIALVNPQVIVTVGRFAMEQFLPGTRISQVHGKLHLVDGRRVVPIIHPAAALHNGSWRPLLEADFVALGQILTQPATSGDAPAREEARSPLAPPPGPQAKGEQLSLF